jgi:hypothetical protein
MLHSDSGGTCPCFRRRFRSSLQIFFFFEGENVLVCHLASGILSLGIDGRKYSVFGRSIVPAFKNDFDIDCLVVLRETGLPDHQCSIGNCHR